MSRLQYVQYVLLAVMAALALASYGYGAYLRSGADFRGCGISRDISYYGIVCAWNLK